MAAIKGEHARTLTSGQAQGNEPVPVIRKLETVMAGHFIVWRITPQQKDGVIQNCPGSAWSGLAHAAGVMGGGGAFPGWTPASRAILDGIRNGIGAPANRNGFPPHRYLQFPGGAPAGATVDYLRKCEWVTSLYIPTFAGVGMVQLCVAARAKWDSGDKGGALIEQITHGATSVEVYYLGKKEMV